MQKYSCDDLLLVPANGVKSSMLKGYEMTEFFFVRHGQTDANREGLMCGGEWNLELNVEGFEQARQAQASLRRKLSRVGAYCVSPLLRTRQTVAVLNAELPAPIQYLEDLQEWRLGEWNRRPFLEVKEDFLGEGEPPLGEKRDVFRERVHRALKLSWKSSAPLVIVSHGGVWLAVQDILGLERFRLTNGTSVHVWKSGDLWKSQVLTAENQ